MLPRVTVLLSAAPEVVAIVGASPPRIFGSGRAPQGTPAPYVTWFLLSGTPENNLSDTPPTDRMNVRVDSWHKTEPGVEQLALAVRDVLERRGHMTQIAVQGQEQNTGLYRIGLEFDIWLDRGRQVQ